MGLSCQAARRREIVTNVTRDYRQGGREKNESLPMIRSVVWRCAGTRRPDVMAVALFDDNHRVTFGRSSALLIEAGRNRSVVRFVGRCVVVIITFRLSDNSSWKSGADKLFQSLTFSYLDVLLAASSRVGSVGRRFLLAAAAAAPTGLEFKTTSTTTQLPHEYSIDY